MNVFLIIYILLIIYMFYDFRKAFLIHIILKIFLNQNINLINLPGVPLLTLELSVNIIFLVFFFTFKRELLHTRKKFPLTIGFVFVFFSILLSTIFSTVGFSDALTRAIQEIINSYLIVYILWFVIKDFKDIKFLINGFVVVFILLGLYGFYEWYTGLNPIIDYEISLNPEGGNIIEFAYGDDRLGLGRVRSAILHPIGFGVYLAVFLNFFLYLITNTKKILNVPIYIKIAVIFLCLTNLLFTNSRSPLIYFFITILSIFQFRNKYSYQIIAIAILSIILSFNLILPYWENIISLSNPIQQNDLVGGSSGEMRISQFAAGLKLLSQSPLIGLGIKSADTLHGNESELFGLESVWLLLMVERGIIGILSHVILLVFIFKQSIGPIRSFVWFSTFAWLILTSITSIPGCNISFFLTIIIILVKAKDISQKIHTKNQCCPIISPTNSIG